MGTMTISVLTTIIFVACAVASISLTRIARNRGAWMLGGIVAMLLALLHTVNLWRAPVDPVTATICLFTSIFLLAGLLAVRSLCKKIHAPAESPADQPVPRDKTREYFDHITNNTPIIVYAIDTEGVITMSKGRGLTGLGFQPGELVGQSVFDIYGDYPEIVAIIRRALSGEKISTTIDFMNLSYDTHYIPIRDDQGNLAGTFGVATDVTKRRQSEKQLHATKERFRSLVETTSDWVWEIDSDGVYTYSSPQVKHLLGYNPNDLIGKTPFDLLSGDAADRFAGELRNFILRQKPFENMVTVNLHKDGREVILETSAVPVLDKDNRFVGYRGINRDVTVRVKAAEALRKEKETAQLYLDIVGVILIALDKDGVITLINRKGCEILGHEEKDIIGKNWFENFVPEDERSEVSAVYRKLMNNETALAEYYENTVLTGSREERIIAWHNTILKSDSGEIAGTLSSGVDVTDEKSAERAKLELEEQLRYSQRMEMIGTLAGGIAHDFNNILFPILGYSDLALEDTDENDPVHRYLVQIVEAGERAKSLVEQILLFSKRTGTKASPIHLHLIIREALKFLRASLPSTIDIQQNVKIDAGVVSASATQIHQLLVNLCTNAAHAMREGGGVLRITLEPFDVDEQMAARYVHLHAGPYARLTVSDTGCGMDEQMMERMFEPFYTAGEIHDGVGLGLAVVHGIVRSHNGEIVVESAPGEGTTITVFFPHANERPKEAPENIVISITGHEHVLFVDDEPAIITLAKTTLERLGYKVTTATNGEEAIGFFNNAPDTFDIVVTDQTMPLKTGLDLVEEIRKTRSRVPVILMTGFSDKITRENLDQLLVNKLLMKPVTGNTLGDAIRRALNDNIFRGDK